MNSKNSKTSKPHVLKLKLTDKLELTRGGKNVALSNISIYYNMENKKAHTITTDLKISAPIWNGKVELPDGSYSVSDIHNYFEYNLKKNSEKLIIHQ